MANSQKSLVDRFKVSISSTGRTFVLTDNATGYAYEFGISDNKGVEGRLLFKIDYPNLAEVSEQDKKPIKGGDYVFAVKR